MDILHAMSDALIKYETIDKDQINDLMNGKTPQPPQGWDEDSSDGSSGNPETKIEENPSSDGKIGGPAGEH